jgi:hypothetical protein
MTLKEQLLQEIEALPSARLAEVLTFVQSLSTKLNITRGRQLHLRQLHE